MFVIGSNSASTGYNLTRSLRFRASASANLSRTMTTPTNNLKWTLSAWVKRGSVLTTENQIMNAGTAGSDDQFVFSSSSQLGFYVANGAAYYLITNAVFRDPAAWYHIVFVYDSANATAANRLLMYVNGTQVTSFATALYPTQNYASQINSAVLNRIGLRSNSASPLDGYLTEVNFIDGQALTPSSFGSTNSLTGVWQPARYTGTYGTNGFYLPFTDNSALTTSSNAGLGKDFSGNGNFFTTNNISITAGATYDSMTDVPTLTSATAANFCVINPLQKSTNATITNGNLSYSGGATSQQSLCTIGVTSGKWYWEDTKISGTYGFAGLAQANANLNTYAGNDAYSWAYNINGNKYNNGVATAYGATWTSGDVIGVAFDATAGSLTFYKNNVSQGVAFTGLTSGPYFASCCDFSTVGAINFGQRPFTYTPPTGFVALNTFNLPTSTIVKGNTVMDATLYTGNGATQTITNAAGFKPDLVWIKGRSSSSQDHTLVDSVRGISRRIRSNATTAEVLESGFTVTAFNSSGFTAVDDTNGGYNVNGSVGGTFSGAGLYVGWQWQAGQGSTSSNTNGTITSTVSVNASAGFSVVTYTGTGANATVGHGLGVAPSLVICKRRVGAGNWIVYHASIGNTGALWLNDTVSTQTTAAYWNNTSPTSTVFTVNNGGDVNNASTALVAYCWTPIAGYSAFGSYTGNGSADGPFVYTGFRPAVIMVKRTNTTGNWCMFDDKRLGYNGTSASKELYPNLSNAEGTSNGPDQLSNGFKLRDTYSDVNASGGTYIYACWAKTPFKNALAR